MKKMFKCALVMLSTLAISACATKMEISREEAEERASSMFSYHADNLGKFSHGGVKRDLSIKQTIYENGIPITSSIYYHQEKTDGSVIVRPDVDRSSDNHIKVIKKIGNEKEETHIYYRFYNEELDTMVLWYQRCVGEEKQTSIYLKDKSSDYSLINNSFELYDIEIQNAFYPYTLPSRGLEQADSFELDWVDEFSEYTSDLSIRYFTSGKYHLDIKATRNYFHNNSTEPFASGSLDIDNNKVRSLKLNIEQNAPGFGTKSIQGKHTAVEKFNIPLPSNWKNLIVD